MLGHSLLCSVGHFSPRNHRSMVQWASVAPPAWLLLPSSNQTRLTLLKLQNWCHISPDLQNKGGPTCAWMSVSHTEPKHGHCAGINSSLFHWSIIHGYSWKSPAHINVLELQATLNAFKWRVRKAQNIKCRCLHVIDNQAVCAIIAKVRCSAYRLQSGLKKLNSLVLASGIVLAVGYVATNCNPSDIPSRWCRAVTAAQKKARKEQRKGQTLHSQMISPAMHSRTGPPSTAYWHSSLNCNSL